MSWIATLVENIDRHGTVVRVTVVRADGSTPREVGAAMYVSPDGVLGTIGGGALELAVIDHARAMLGRHEDNPTRRAPNGATPDSLFPPSSGHRHAPPLREGPGERGSGRRLDTASWPRDTRDFPLGPSLGQCCGGYARLLFEVLTQAERDHLIAIMQDGDDARTLVLRPLAGGAPLQAAADRKEHRREWPLGVTRAVRDMLSGARPRVPLLVRGAKGGTAWLIEPLARPVHRLHLYGAGHVGRAIVRVLEDLPFAVTWIDTSAGRFPEHFPSHATAQVAPDPAVFAGGAEADAFHLVLTYSHALDLAICHSLLRRGDFRFLGLIGSATKRARFLKRLADLGIGEALLARLVCPIGLPGVGGKEPAAIAVSVAAQLVQLALSADACASAPASRREDAAR
jgi:xanthine dehydrogenase accessory factor